jgi:hypothetical protein
MWIGKGPFDSYGFQKNPYVHGQGEGVLPTCTYQIQNKTGPNSRYGEFWAVPVDEHGKENGPVTFKVTGREMYGYWERWNGSKTIFMMNISAASRPPISKVGLLSGRRCGFGLIRPRTPKAPPG